MKKLLAVILLFIFSFMGYSFLYPFFKVIPFTGFIFLLFALVYRFNYSRITNQAKIHKKEYGYLQLRAYEIEAHTTKICKREWYYIWPNDFAGSAVYRNLISGLDTEKVIQQVYATIRHPAQNGRNRIVFNTPGSRIIYRQVLNYYTRLYYGHKIRKVVADVTSQVPLEKVSIIHAHTWYSDGGVAHDLSVRFNIPYCIAIRNTDINIFFKYMLHLRRRGIRILQGAQKIFFISPMYLQRVCMHPYFKPYLQELESKFEIIPNGIDNYWLQHSHNRCRQLAAVPRLLYVGNFSRNKDVPTLLKAALLLNKEGHCCVLELVGAGGSDYERVMNMVRAYPRLFFYRGEIREHEVLQKIYQRSDVFVMPSKRETFGLVYVEALSQGVPVLYSKGEGIDGYFPAYIGEGVIPGNARAVADKLKHLLKNYEQYRFNSSELLSPFNWEQIACRYKNIYRQYAKNDVAIHC